MRGYANAFVEFRGKEEEGKKKDGEWSMVMGPKNPFII